MNPQGCKEQATDKVRRTALNPNQPLIWTEMHVCGENYMNLSTDCDADDDSTKPNYIASDGGSDLYDPVILRRHI